MTYLNKTETTNQVAEEDEAEMDLEADAETVKEIDAPPNHKTFNQDEKIKNSHLGRKNTKDEKIMIFVSSAESPAIRLMTARSRASDENLFFIRGLTKEGSKFSSSSAQIDGRLIYRCKPSKPRPISPMVGRCSTLSNKPA